MPKKYSKIDLGFFIFIFAFILVCGYEIIMLIAPYYSFFKAIVLVFIVSGLYLGYKNDFSSIVLKRNVQVISSGRNQSEMGKHIKFFIEHKDYILYASFIGVSIVILLGLLFNTGGFTSLVLGLFGVLFVIVKLLGFTIKAQLLKNEPSNMNAVRFFLLSFAIFFIVMKLICDNFGLIQAERLLIYLAFSFVYLVGGFLLFFNCTFSGIFRPYNILSAVLVFSLVGVLTYNNGVGNWFKNYLSFKPVIVEDMNLPGIISDEIEIKDVKYEQILVSNLYNIDAGLGVGSSDENVSKLQKVLGNLQYFTGEVSGNFDEDTRVALRETLIGECDWPESTSGRFGPQAKECIDNLSISVLKKSEEEKMQAGQEIISSEIAIGEEEIEDTEEDTKKNTQEQQLISSLYSLEEGLSVGSTGEAVTQLQKVLQSLGYYKNNLGENFDEDTRIALRNTLIGECQWPESTSGIFGPQAKQCIDNLKIFTSQ